MTADLIRVNEYDDPDDDSPAERAARIAFTRYQRALDKARSVEAFDAAQQRLQADLDAARTLDRTLTTSTPR